MHDFLTHHFDLRFAISMPDAQQDQQTMSYLANYLPVNGHTGVGHAL